MAKSALAGVGIGGAERRGDRLAALLGRAGGAGQQRGAPGPAARLSVSKRIA
jgi:hypothetical protein